MITLHIFLDSATGRCAALIFDHGVVSNLLSHGSKLTFLEPAAESSRAHGCTFSYFRMPSVRRIEQLTGPLRGGMNLTVVGAGFSGGTSPLLYVLFGNSPDPEAFTTCDVTDDVTAVCRVPPFFNASGIEDHRGVAVEVMVSLAEEDARQRACLSPQIGSGGVVRFFYHPRRLMAAGPFPILVPRSGAVEQSLLLDATPFLEAPVSRSGRSGGSDGVGAELFAPYYAGGAGLLARHFDGSRYGEDEQQCAKANVS